MRGLVGAALATVLLAPGVSAQPVASSTTLKPFASDKELVAFLTTCDLATERLACSATGVLGSGSRDFYVSGKAVYVWIDQAFGGDSDDNRSIVYRLPLDGSRPGAAQAWGGPVDQLSAPHGVDRIDIMGSDAVVIGSDSKERLGFSSIELTGTPRLGDTSFLPAAREGERRSQAFFYKSDPDSRDGASGILGLPVSRDLGNSPAARFLGAGSAVAFLRRDDRRFTPAGELEARAEAARDDGCQASCVDWYGNARPIFLGDRTFALMGYELVEGRVQGGRINEVRRLNFAPSGKGMP